jgi:hypothetical protein
LEPTTGALGTSVASFPANTGLVAELNLAQTFTATQTFAAISASSFTGTGSGPATVQMVGGTFATLTATYPCNSGNKGMMATVTDSTTNTWGATITGSGSDTVGAFCDGTNWTVFAD